MKFKIAAHRLSYLASFSYFLFGSAALAHANTLFPDSKIKIVFLPLAGIYALFAVIAYFHILRQPKSIHEPVFSVPVQRCIRAVALGIPLPFVVFYAAVAIFSGIACGAGFAGEMFESIGRYDLAKACYEKRLQFHQALDSKQMIADLATLGGICDKQGAYGEAERYFQDAELLVPCAELRAPAKPTWSEAWPTVTPFSEIYAADWIEQPWAWRRIEEPPVVWGRGTYIAFPRLLRLLNQVPEEKARKEFSFANAVLKRRGESSLMLGKRFALTDLRPVIRDYRKAPIAVPGGDPFPPQLDSEAPSAMASTSNNADAEGSPPTDNSSVDSSATNSCDGADPIAPGDGTIGPTGGGATAVMGVSSAGSVVTGEQLRTLLRRIPRDVALNNFEFASTFYPSAQNLHAREEFPGDPLPGTFLKPTTVRELIPDHVSIIEHDQYLKLYWLGKSGSAVVHPREIDVVFEVDKTHKKPKTDWIKWITERANASGFAAHIRFQKSAHTPAHENIRALPGEVIFSLTAQENRTSSGNYSSQLSETEVFAWIKSAFDDALRNHVWQFYTKPNQKVKHIQVFIDKSNPNNLSEQDKKRIIARGRSLGYETRIHDDRVDKALFSSEEFSNWGETVVLDLTPFDGEFTPFVRGKGVYSWSVDYPFPWNRSPNVHRFTFAEKVERSIDFAADSITGSVY